MDQAVFVKLNTLLNTHQAHPRSLKRVRDPDNDWYGIVKRVKLAKQAQTAASKLQNISSSKNPNEDANFSPAGADEIAGIIDQGTLAIAQLEFIEKNPEAAEADEATEDAFKAHFGAETTLLSASALAAVQESLWVEARLTSSGLGDIVETRLATNAAPALSTAEINVNASLLGKLKSSMPSNELSALQNDLLHRITSYKDISLCDLPIQDRASVRSVLSLHAMSHINKTRNRVLRNNEHLAAAAKDGAVPVSDKIETRDQGFTRPKVLILLPFRNAALPWVETMSSLSLATSVENAARFRQEFSLPDGAIDKLALPDAASKYAPDHIANFAGNIDDSFRIGLKVTRKTLKLYSEFYSSDILIGSPLGLRMSIEKENDSDYLSSIEMVIVDQADVLTMQNWEHVQFVFDRLNKIPEQAHGADFARIKPWYLDGKAALLRQTILLSSYETPEIRHLYNTLRNVSGKVRTSNETPGVIANVRRGVKQVLTRFDAPDNGQTENEARFELFKSEVFPNLLKSAVASSGNTMIFVPSYFDFLRVENYLKSIEDLDFACISEYSTNSEVAKARNAFLSGKLPFLVITERFQFFKRYRIRGIKQLVFYALPERAALYQELLALPFEQVPNSKYDVPDVSEVLTQTVFSRFDQMRLARVFGSASARKMLTSGETRYTFK